MIDGLRTAGGMVTRVDAFGRLREVPPDPSVESNEAFVSLAGDGDHCARRQRCYCVTYSNEQFAVREVGGALLVSPLVQISAVGDRVEPPPDQVRDRVLRIVRRQIARRPGADRLRLVAAFVDPA